ncbi:hypothetical protein AB0G82_38180 [Streptomyces anulatus]|uniref:hypothetical protein n=1 Tax=Streptomyces anulatus TaxID=1892 RepID=UPI0033F115E7
MKKLFAVTMTAALALPAVATTAAAENETITIEGANFLDRNANGKFDEGETLRPDTRMQVKDLETRQIVWDSHANRGGRYHVELRKGPKYSITVDLGAYTAERTELIVSEDDAHADFAFTGTFLSGFTFVDSNGDGVKQADEKPHTGKVKVSGVTRANLDFNAETEADANGAYLFDLPLGDLTITAPDLRKSRLTLAEPKSANDIDWLTGTRAVGEPVSRRLQVDLRYVEAKADFALASTITPLEETYTVGDQIELRLAVSNKGNVPVAPTVVLGSFAAKLLSHSPNVTVEDDDVFTTVDKILPGEQAEIALKIELDDVEYAEVHAMVRFVPGGYQDVDPTNNVVSTLIKVVGKAGESTAPTTTTTTAPASTTTTTTAPAVAQAGTRSGLASTGASPLGFLALGVLLLAAGTSAFFVARRRRS